MEDQPQTVEQAVVRAINHNTRAILALARLLSERLSSPLKVEGVFMTDDGPVAQSNWTPAMSEAAARARLGVHAHPHPTDPALVVVPGLAEAIGEALDQDPTTDREMIEEGLRLVRQRADKVGHERQG